MKISIGSKNPKKIEAILNASKTVLSEEAVEYSEFAVESGVSDQPMSAEETIKGAKQRAVNALGSDTDAAIGIGLESGLEEIEGQWFATVWAAVTTREDAIYIGSGVRMSLPDDILSEIKGGKDLGQACYACFGIKEPGKKQGFFGVMSSNAITRSSASRDAVIAALSAMKASE